MNHYGSLEFQPHYDLSSLKADYVSFFPSLSFVTLSTFSSPKYTPFTFTSLTASTWAGKRPSSHPATAPTCPPSAPMSRSTTPAGWETPATRTTRRERSTLILHTSKLWESNSGVIDSTPPKAAVHWLLPSAKVGLLRVSYLLRGRQQGDGNVDHSHQVGTRAFCPWLSVKRPFWPLTRKSLSLFPHHWTADSRKERKMPIACLLQLIPPVQSFFFCCLLGVWALADLFQFICRSYAYGEGYVLPSLGSHFPIFLTVIDPKNIFPRTSPIFPTPPAALYGQTWVI